ncbi:hypothetical protein M0813_01724 [Anaeramoeba flamelloides]|uniref:BTB domain-containing protein n=1 Tax=Anaeramoeba flamelloides TaxID=1746091 RepID=A0ABQ8YWX3_9EUKA|nr:hypothetical protein M0813_01724 [Anaeramoeba flamelloides]
MNKIYILGNNSKNSLGDKRLEKFEKPTELDFFGDNSINIIEFAGTNVSNCFLSDEGIIYSIPNNSLEKFDLDEKIVSIKAGCNHFLALSSGGYVYGWGKNDYGQCQSTQIGTNILVPTLIEELKNKNITEIDSSGWNSFFFNKEEGKVWACGYNSNCECGGSKKVNKLPITLVHQNVQKIYTGKTEHSFIQNLNGDILAFGYNYYGQCGIGSTSNVEKPTKIKELCNLEIKDISPGIYHSIALTEGGDLYGVGSRERLSMEGKKGVFTKYENIPKDVKFSAIASGYEFSVALTQTSEIYVFGHWCLGRAAKPTKINGSVDPNLDRIICNYNFGCWFMDSGSDEIQNDLNNLFETGIESDEKIHGIPVHKIFLKTRLKKSFEEIKNIMENNYSKEDIQNFLKYIYSGSFFGKHQEIFSKIFKSFGFNSPKELNLLSDLKTLMKDDESKDFNILVEIDDEVDDDEDDEDDNFEEVPVHRFILAARSGLFREMFTNLENVGNSVKDFSGNTIETIELLVSYFYTSSFDVTADHDKELIKEELESAVDYYKIITKNNLINLFEKCSIFHK